MKISEPLPSLLLASALAASVVVALQAQGRVTGEKPDSSPDIIYVNGNILTGAHLTAAPDSSTIAAHVSALAITNSSIVAAGSDAVLLKLRGPHTEVIDLHGAFAMPGFNDAHTHMAEAGQQKLTVDLDGSGSLADMLDRIRTYTASAPTGSWILGAGWDQTKWASGRLPDRQDLDRVTAGHPAVFYRTDGHIVVANSAALLAVGISSATQDPAGGKIDRDSSGTPTGIVRETPAVSIIYARVPPPDPEMRRKALNVAIADALAHGVTSVQDFSSWDDWLTLETMEHTGKLNLRFSEWIDFNLPLAVLKDRRASHPAKDPLLHIGMLKAFMDGSLGSRTAAMTEPYADDANNSGIPRYPQQKLNAMAQERAAAGFQLGFHAIGDAANHMALNAFEAAEQVGVSSMEGAAARRPDASIVTSSEPALEPRDLRLRIEHAQVLLPEDFQRMEKLGVIASMQPSHLLDDINWAGARLGPERSRYAYAWRSMLDHHIALAFGTDYPVEPINPFRGLYAALTRKNIEGTKTFDAAQRISLAEAIYAYTQGSAYAEFREHRKGRLEPGFLADFIVVDRDLMTASPVEILHARVLRTVMGGRTVYLSNSNSSSHIDAPLSPDGLKAGSDEADGHR